MGRTSAVDKLDAETKKKVKEYIVNKKTVREIARHIDTSKDAVQRYKDKMKEDIATKAAQDVQETYDLFKESIGTWEMMQKDYVALFKMYYEKSMQGDKEAKKALKQLLAIGKELRPLTADIVKIIGDIKETTEVNNRPALIVAQISQIIQTSDIKDREVLLDRIRIIADR